MFSILAQRVWALCRQFAWIIAPHDTLDGTQQPLESILAQHGNLDVRLGDDTGGTWLVVQQSQFAKVVARVVLLELVLAAAFVDGSLARL